MSKIALKKVLANVFSKISEIFTDVVYCEKQCVASYSAGTIGTRGAQVSFANPAPEEYYIRSVMITYVSDSSTFHPIAFYNSSDKKFYVNFYRASTAALNGGTVNVRIVYTKTKWGGTPLAVFSRLSAISRRFSKEVA